MAKAPKQIQYNVITGIDIISAMKGSAKSTTATRSAGKADATVWNQTVASAMESYRLEALPGNGEEAIKQVREHLMENMEAAIYTSYTNAGEAIPETGKDRDGKTIVLVNEKTGKLKFSSWEETRRIWAYLGDIAKVICNGKALVLYPETFKVAARCDILAECKGVSTPIENVRRLVDQMSPYLAVLESSDSIEAQTLVDSLVVNDVAKDIEASGHIRNLDRIISNANPVERSVIEAMLVAMAQKYFTA